MSARRKSRKTLIWIVSSVGLIIVIALLFGPVKKKYFDSAPTASDNKVTAPDPFCQFAEKVQYRCVVAPAQEGLLGPGKYMKYSQDGPKDAKVPFKEGDLFNQGCVVSGVNAAKLIKDIVADLAKQEGTNKLPYDDVVFKFDRTFKGNGNLTIPELGNIKLQAGPKMTEVQEVDVRVPHAMVKVIDRHVFVDILAAAAIKDTCIDDFASGKSSVVSAAAIIQDYSVSVIEKAGQSFELSAAVKKDQLQMNAGGEAGGNVDEVISKNSKVPVVIAVNFFEPDIFRKERARLVAPIFSATGRSTTRAQASGRSGQLWAIERHAPIGQSLPVEQSGGGQSDVRCGVGKPSIMQVTSLISLSPQQSLGSTSYEYTVTGTITRGFSSFASGFAGLNCQTAPENVQAEVSFDSTVKAVVRSDATRSLLVDLKNIPEGQAQVTDWQGRQLERRTPDGVQAADGVLTFQLVGAGAYDVHLTGRTNLSTNGGIQAVNLRGTFKITIQ